jgi:hypothetical protein
LGFVPQPNLRRHCEEFTTWQSQWPLITRLPCNYLPSLMQKRHYLSLALLGFMPQPNLLSVIARSLATWQSQRPLIVSLCC